MAFHVSGFKKLMHGEGALKNTVLTALAEMIGTSMLVFLGCMGCIGSLGVIPSHLQIALTFGLAVMIVIQVGNTRFSCRNVKNKRVSNTNSFYE